MSKSALTDIWKTSLLVQVGLIDREGAEQVDRLLDPTFAVQVVDS
jgi:hypothetical protein